MSEYQMLPSDRVKKINRVTIQGLVINVCLLFAKIISGLLIGSSALIADGIHSGTDMVTDLVVLVGNRISNRPPDKTHPFGHKKFETLAVLLIAAIMGYVSFILIWEAGKAVFSEEVNYPGIVVLIIAFFSIIAKEYIFRLTQNVSKQTNSTSLHANAWHHRSDAFSSAAVLVGGVAGLFGWGYADQAATIVVGFMIMTIALKLFSEGLIEITDQSADKESIQKIEKILKGDSRILNWHRLRSRKVGGELFLDMHVLVSSLLTVKDSHDITVELEEKMKSSLSTPVNLLIHIEPDDVSVPRNIDI